MKTRRVLLVALCLVAFAHAGFFIEHMRPDREQFWASPPAGAGGYTWLAWNLLHGRYTQDQAPGAAAAPDSQRTPGYPLFLSLVYLAFGFRDTPVLWVQALLFVALCLGVYALGRRLGGERAGWLAAFATALYPPIPKYGAMVWSELLTTFLQVMAVLLVATALERGSRSLHVAAGAVLGVLALTRPALLFEAVVLAAAIVACHWWSPRRGAVVRQAGLLLLAWLLVLAPWMTFNYVRFGRATPTVARTFGKQLWYGYWVAKFPTPVLLRLEDVVVRVQRGTATREEVPALVRPLGGDPRLMARFVEEYTWRNHFAGPARSPEERTRENMQKDRFYLERALDHIRGDFWSYLRNQLFFVSFKFWAGEIPVRLLLIGSLPRPLLYAGFLVQAAILALGLVGAWRLRTKPLALALLAVPLLYLWLAHLPFHVEPRYSLPVKPLLLLLAAVGAWGVARVPAHAALPSWRAVRWVAQDFEGASLLGVGLDLVRLDTGETRRLVYPIRRGVRGSPEHLRAQGQLRRWAEAATGGVDFSGLDSAAGCLARQRD